MNVLYCFDEGYARIVAVSMISYARLHRGTNFHMFTLNTIHNETYDELRRIAKEYNSEVFFYDVTKPLRKFEKLFLHRHLNLGMLARLIVADIIPQNIEKILYLDGDTLVLSKIWEKDFDMEGYSVLGVYDNSMPPMGIKKSIGLFENEIYINSGVLLINLNRWREKNISQLFYDFFSKHPDVIFWDQDAINYVCRGEIGLLPLSYNMTFITQEIPYKISKRLFESHTYNFYSKNDLVKAQHEPKIIHFAGEVLGKPWTEISYIKYTKEWRKIDKTTIWGKLPYSKRIYSNNKYISIYKKFCEGIIAKAYVKNRYSLVCFWYSIFYKFPHFFKSTIRR